MESKIVIFFVYLSVIQLLSEARGVSYSGPNSNPDIRFEQLKRFTRQTEVNITNTTTTLDHHIYYNSTFHPAGSAFAEDLWFDLAALADTEVIPVSNLSTVFRVYTAHPLLFKFPFYGHTIDSIAVTTGGFLYTSDFLHEEIHLTQYIAPLQADFNPSLHDQARVLIYSTSERFTVQWDRVHVTDHVENGTFTFQVSLFKDGTIHFVYRDMPLFISEISDEDHPVEVGVADSFYVDTRLSRNLILREIYEYSRIRLSQLQDDLNYSAFVLTPVPNCVPATSCESCVAASSEIFQCGWCNRLSRCSDGVDRFRQEWVLSGCSRSRTTSCSPTPGTVDVGTTLGTTLNTVPIPSTLDVDTTLASPDINTVPLQGSQSQALSTGATVGLVTCIIVVLVLIIMVVGVCIGIVYYGYKRPTSRIGMFMIENRPKARSLNKAKVTYSVNSEKTILD